MPLCGLLEPEPIDQRLEPVAVLGQVDGLGRGAQDRHAGRLERMRELERRLAAELHDHAAQPAVRLLHGDDLEHVLGRERLEIEPVGGVVVGRDRLRVAVDHDGLGARLGEREAGVAAAVVELDALADAVGPAAQDDHLVALRRAWPRRRAGHRLAVLRQDQPALVGRIHVGGGRGELGGAGVDALEHRPHAQRDAPLAHLRLGQLRQLGETRVREAHRLSAAAGARRLPAARAPARALSDVDDLLDARSRNHGSILQEAWICS